jgi:hypothetical protein
MKSDPSEQLKRQLDRYTWFSSIPDIGSYHRLKVPMEGRCMFRGCTEPIAWEDAAEANYLCEGHYLTLARWVQEARSGYLSGGTR